MNTHPYADDLIGAYVLDAVDSAEREAVEAHLDECELCRAEVRELREAAVHLSDGFDVAPPDGLRSQILGAIGFSDRTSTNNATRGTADPRSPGAHEGGTGSTSKTSETQPRGKLTNKSVWGLAAAGLLAVGGWGIWQNVADDLSPIDEVIQAADAETFTTQYEGETLTVVASSSLDRAVLRADGLPVLDEGQTYQAWWIGSDQNVSSAGVVSSDPTAADLEVALEGDPEGASFALTVEPVGGSTQPTTDPVVVVPLS